MYESKKYMVDYQNWEVKKFADKLKVIVCILLECSMEDLEDNNFKEKPLGPQWTVCYWVYRDSRKKVSKIYFTEEEANKDPWKEYKVDLVFEVLTPRRILQLMGTECGTRIIHPNLWVNSLMNKYHPVKEYIGHGDYTEHEPDWIITDVRFENEIKAIKERDGIVLRVNRNKRTSSNWREMFPKVEILDPAGWDRQNYQYSWFEEYITLEEYQHRILQSACRFDNRDIEVKDRFRRFGGLSFIKQYFKVDEHESETALDNYTGFDAIISNDGSVADLKKTIKPILQELKLI